MPIGGEVHHMERCSAIVGVPVDARGLSPATYNASVVDKVFDVDNDYAIRTGRELARQEGLLVGISAGAAAAVGSYLV